MTATLLLEVLEDIDTSNAETQPTHTVLAISATDAERLTDEVKAIRQLIEDSAEKDQQESAQQKLSPPRDEGWYRPALWIGGLAFVIFGIGIISKQPLATLGGLLLLLTIPILIFSFTLVSLRKNWQNRRVESLANAHHLAKKSDLIFKDLFGFSRAALGKAADDLGNFEAKVDRRTSTLTGSGKSGLIAVATFVVAGIAALSRFFADNSDAISPMIREGAWWLFALSVAMAIASLLARHSISATTEYQSLLRQVITAKDTLAKEAKEQREADK